MCKSTCQPPEHYFVYKPPPRSARGPPAMLRLTIFPAVVRGGWFNTESLLFNFRPSKMKALNSFETYGAPPVTGGTACSTTPTWKSQDSSRPCYVTITVTFIEVIKHHYNVGSNTSFKLYQCTQPLRVVRQPAVAYCYAICKQQRTAMPRLISGSNDPRLYAYGIVSVFIVGSRIVCGLTKQSKRWMLYVKAPQTHGSVGWGGCCTSAMQLVGRQSRSVVHCVWL